MTEQEANDLAEAKAKVEAKKLSTYDYLVYVSKYTPQDMHNSGYSKKTRAEAMEMIMADAEKDIKKIWAAHLRKYPD